MTLGVGRGMLLEARRELLAQWARTTEHWDDDNARAFEARFIDPVDRQVRSAVEAMEKLGQIVERARRECE